MFADMEAQVVEERGRVQEDVDEGPLNIDLRWTAVMNSESDSV
jgi:hypothetical protein